MHANQFIISDLALGKIRRHRSDEQDFYEVFGRDPAIRSILQGAHAATRSVPSRMRALVYGLSPARKQRTRLA